MWSAGGHKVSRTLYCVLCVCDRQISWSAPGVHSVLAQQPCTAWWRRQHVGRDGTGRCTPPPNAAAHRRAPQQAAERRLTDDRQAGRARPGTRDPGPISPPSRFVLPPPSRPLVGCGPCQGASCEACAARATRRARRLCEVPCRCLRTRSVSVGRPPHQGQGASYPKFRRLGLAHTCRRLVVVRICLSHRHCGRSGPLGLGPVVVRRLLPAPALV